MILAGVLAIVIPPAAGIAVVLVVAWLLMFSKHHGAQAKRKRWNGENHNLSIGAWAARND